MEDTAKKVRLKKGVTYKLCSCGVSKILPFCDEEHKKLNEETGSRYKSVKITPDQDVDITADCKNWEKE